MSAAKKAIRPRWRKVLSDLWDNKLRTLLVVASITVGVFSVGTIASAFVIISQEMNLSYASANPANIVIITNPFDDDYLHAIENIPGVGLVEGRRTFPVRVSNDGENWMGFDFIAIQDFDQMKVNYMLPIAGALKPGDRELLIEKEALDEMDIQVGDILQVQLQDDTIREMPVAGIVQDQTTSAGDFLASPLGYVTVDSLDWLFQPTTYNRLYATVSEQPNNEAHIRQVSEAITDKLERSGRGNYQTLIYLRDEHPMTSTTQAALGILGALGILMVLLSSSLIANTLSALLSQHLRQIGVMKLIGARSFQVLGMYIVLILSFSAIALLISVPVGGHAGYALADFIAYNFNFVIQGYRLIPAAIVLQIVIATAVPLAAGFMPVNRGARTKVRRAISGDRPQASTAKLGWFDRLGARIRWISRPLLLSIRNTFRRKSRLILTLFTLSMGGAMFIAVFNVRSSLEQYIGQLGKYFLADVTINLDMPYRITQIERAVLQVPGVTDVEGWSFASAEILAPDGSLVENLQILAPPSDSELVDPDVITGRWIVPGDSKAVTVSEAIWEYYPELKPGDQLRLKIQDEEDNWTVVGIFRFTSQAGMVLGYASYETISEITHMYQQAFSYRVVTEEHSRAYQEAMTYRLDESLRARGFRVSEVESGLATMRTVSEAVNILVIFLLIMALLTALVGSIGLTGTMGMNVLERTREIGVMRAIGAVDLEVIKSVVFEGTFIGMISYGIATLLSFPISYLLLRIISASLFQSPIQLSIATQGFGIWLLIVLALAAFASVLPAHNAARLTIREVLAYE